MKLVQSQNGNKIVISKEEWASVGRDHGWIKEAVDAASENVMLMVGLGKKGFDIAGFKVNPYTGAPISPEEVAEAQRQLGLVPGNLPAAPASDPTMAENSDVKKKLKAAETEDELKKEAKWGKDVKVEQPGKWKGHSKQELIKKRDAAKKRQEKRKKEGKKADPKDTELLRELNFAIRAKGDWGKAD